MLSCGEDTSWIQNQSIKKALTWVNMETMVLGRRKQTWVTSPGICTDYPTTKHSPKSQNVSLCSLFLSRFPRDSCTCSYFSFHNSPPLNHTIPYYTIDCL